MEASVLFLARFLGRVQNAFLFGNGGLEFLIFRTQCLAATDPLLQLLGLRVHDELRPDPIAMQVLKRALVSSGVNNPAQMSEVARQLIHHLLRFPPILQERIEPDLAQLQSRRPALGFADPMLRLNPGRDRLIELRQVAPPFGRPEEKREQAFFRPKLRAQAGHAQSDSLFELVRRPTGAKFLPGLARRALALEQGAVQKNQRMRRELRLPDAQFCAQTFG